MNPLQYAIYKGTGGKHGAIQFNLQPPHFYRGKDKSFDGKFMGESIFESVDGKRRLKEGWKIREGAIFMEVASAKDKNVYDWENKIIMALSVNDMGKVLVTLLTGNQCELMHDPGAKSESQGVVKKYLTVSSPKGTLAGVIFSATQVSGGQKRTHTVPLTGDEVIVLGQLLRTAISSAMAW